MYFDGRNLNFKLQKQYHIATLRHKLTQHMNTEHFATETIQLFLDFSQIIMICFMQYKIYVNTYHFLAYVFIFEEKAHYDLSLSYLDAWQVFHCRR